MKYITRIAPSPTGDMHLGTARTAYFNFLAARASGGKFILRIDDTDQNRNDDSVVQVIYDTMDWLGLDYDALYVQSKNRVTYNEIANDLVRKGKAHYIDDSIAVALKIETPDVWHDEVAGDVKASQNMDEIVIIKSDGMPTYNFASVVDDHMMGVNFIIRGNDHLANTPKQIGIFNALGWDLPKFNHIGLIHYNKKKMSKRDNAASMLHYRDQGYCPEAILNFMLRLGWGPTVDDKSTKMIDKERAIKMFLTDGKMRAAPSNMDLAMLDSFNRKYCGLPLP